AIHRQRRRRPDDSRAEKCFATRREIAVHWPATKCSKRSSHRKTGKSFTRRSRMKIGISTSVIQRGKTGIAQYVFALLRALKHYAREHEFVLFVLEDDLALFDFVKETMRIVPVAENFRAPL